MKMINKRNPELKRKSRVLKKSRVRLNSVRKKKTGVPLPVSKFLDGEQLRLNRLVSDLNRNGENLREKIGQQRMS